MNELQRQHYLSALGVDTYMPRWHLPFAPMSFACEVSIDTGEGQSSLKSETVSLDSLVDLHKTQSTFDVVNSNFAMGGSDRSSASDLPIGHLISDMLAEKKSNVAIPRVTSAADILAQLDTKPVTITPFSLSIWRPFDGIMIVDSRNTKLALPTELFLNNMLRSMFSEQQIKTQEEVLRWPMIENSFTKRTVDDARTELQTWLSVQNEIRSIHYLWLMGENSSTYLLPDSLTYSESLYKSAPVAGSSINALILPSLNELLQKPLSKQKLFSVLRLYHSVN